jgi:hypothetical protein
VSPAVVIRSKGLKPIQDGRALEGLAMLLVDVDYDGKLFEVDRTAFGKDIGEDGEVKIGALKGDVALIAIDKQGNESKVKLLK